MTSLVSPLLGENALFADIGKIFHPLFEFFGLISRRDLFGHPATTASPSSG